PENALRTELRALKQYIKLSRYNSGNSSGVEQRRNWLRTEEIMSRPNSSKIRTFHTGSGLVVGTKRLSKDAFGNI
ncbi:33515_t:CDS:2, partial [Racocetra persica]